jgi:hypothetical protein
MALMTQSIPEPLLHLSRGLRYVSEPVIDAQILL